MGFEDMHAQWLNAHMKRRTGERRSRLQRGHGHGERLFLERVWWPLFGHFDDLHPEYEVIDWRGHPYFVDFVRIRGQLRFAFEIKGYGPHVQHADRTLCGAFLHHSPRSRPGGRRKRAGPAVTGRCLRGPGYGRSRGAHSSIRASIASASRDRSCGAGIGGRPSRSQRFCAISRLPSGFRWSQSRISFA